MLCIINDRMDPAFNLAAEEYLLNIVREPAFMLWRSRPSVIIGRNQNPYRQADIVFLDRINIPVVRRISGGGAVYHDPGNINFTVIRPTGDRLTVDYRTPLQPIRRFLKRMGLAAEFDGTSGLSLHGKKISGNAQHVRKGMALHHGTLLYEADLDMLSNALQRSANGRYRDRSVDSVRRPVVNLRPLMPRDLPAHVFMQQLMADIQSTNGGRRACLSSADEAEIEDLARSKYRTWQWNFGRSPQYRFVNTARLDRVPVRIQLRVDSGIIRSARITGDLLSEKFTNGLGWQLEGCRHHRQDVEEALKKMDWPADLNAVGRSSLTAALF